MTYWTLEQALTWAMWRDEGRANRAADGDPSAALPRSLGEIPDEDPGKLLGWLLEHGNVRFLPLEQAHPHRGWEERWAFHHLTGDVVSIMGWREREGAPLCIDGTLRWQPRNEKPILSAKEAKKDLHSALRDGRVLAKAEPLTAPGVTVDVPTSAWLHVELRLSSSPKIGGHMGPEGYTGGRGATRLRFRAEEIKKLWPGLQKVRELSGAAAGKWYRDFAIDQAARNMLAREAKGLSTTDDDIAVTLENLAIEYEDGGASQKSVGRWTPRVRTRMAELKQSSS